MLVVEPSYPQDVQDAVRPLPIRQILHDDGSRLARKCFLRIFAVELARYNLNPKRLEHSPCPIRCKHQCVEKGDYHQTGKRTSEWHEPPRPLLRRRDEFVLLMSIAED